MQYPRPIGPTINIDAPASVEMTQGVTAPRGRYRAPFHQGWLAQTPDVPVFSIEMVVGVHADRSRAFLAPRIPLPVSQTTHIDAPFSPEMVAGSAPSRNRAFVFPKTGWTVSETTPLAAAFSIEMVAGVSVLRRRDVSPFHAGAQLWAPEVEAFGIEQVMGSRPDRPRLLFGPRIGQPSSQTTHVAAPLSVEMAAGVAVGRRRNVAPFHSGAQVWVPEVDAFSIEQVAGSHPDAHRVRLAPRLWPSSSQVTHIAAAFSVEMIQGSRPMSAKPRTTARIVGMSMLPDPVVQPLLPFKPAWAVNSNRTIGMDIQPE